MHRIHRRRMLQTAGVCLGLPWLESLAKGATAGADRPRRLICICSPLGIHAPHLFPAETGKGYRPTPYLEPLAPLRDQFTVISGLAHPDVGPFHDSMNSFLTGAAHPENRTGFRNTISLDQFAAERMHGLTRFPSLTLAAEGAGLAWTRSGAPVPADAWPSRVFRRMFINGSPQEVRAELHRLRSGRSILDALSEKRASLNRQVNARDAEKLDEYYSSVRELERNLASSEQWSTRPKPTVSVPPLNDVTNQADILQQEKVWYALILLALQTDSTRLVTLTLSGLTGVPVVDGVSLGYHDLSHHGQDAAKIEQLQKIELSKMRLFGDFLQQLRDAREEDQTLLDRTIVYYGSNLGNASSHDVRNLPILLAGGDFQHGQHLAFDLANHPPLSNLYVTLLQRLGLEVDRFATSTGTLTGL